MITFIGNGIQRIIIALFDKKIESESILFSFNFINELTHKEDFFLDLPDVSVHKDRYSEFIIFHNLENGFYTYQVLEGDEIITTGRLQVLNDSFSDTKIIRYEDYDGEFKAYQG
jgi:hypothetical protein